MVACKPYLLAEIKKVKPKAILLLGDLPMQQVLGIKGITKERGKVIEQTFEYEDETLTIPCIPTFACGYVDYNDKALQHFGEDIQKAYNLSRGVEIKKSNTRIVQITTLADFKQLIKYVLAAGICSFDYETTKLTNLETYDPEFKVTLISISFQHGSAYTIAMEHFESPFDDEDRQYIWAMFFKWILENPDIHKVMHNSKFEMHVSARYGCTRIRGRVDDTMLMHHILDETRRHGLKDIVDYLYPEYEGYEDEVKRYAWHLVPMDILAPYGGTDADLTLRLRDYFEIQLMKDEREYNLYRNFTMYVNRALFDAEHRGMLVDREKLIDNIQKAKEILTKQEEKLRNYKQVKRFEQHQTILKNGQQIEAYTKKLETSKGKWVEEYKRRIREIKLGVITYGAPINFASSTQLSELLFTPEGFGYKKVYSRKKKKEVASTGKEILGELPDRTGFIEDLQVYRSIDKTINTYLVGIYERLDANDRIHTSFKLHGTKSGRSASTNPNLQNLPSRAKLSNELAIRVTEMVKEVFITPKGKEIAQLDYSQAELRIVADFAEEFTMIKAYQEDKDLHAVTGAKLMKLSFEAFMALPDDEKKKGRTNAKPANFGLIYGQSPEGYMQYAKQNYKVILTKKEAEQTRKDFFGLYPKLLEYHALYIAKGQKYGFVRTLFGRKRHVPDINSSDNFLSSNDERVAVNSPVQGTAGEFTLFAFALLRDRLHPDVDLVNTIHDSIIPYVPKDIMDQTFRMAKLTCENLPTEKYFERSLKYLGMKVDIEKSDSRWSSMKPYELSE